MPDRCCVAGCPNIGTHGGVIHYYSFPQVIDNKGDDIKRLSSLRRERWITGVKAKKPLWEPNKSSRICSCHFASGRKAILTDFKSPDWVPTLFMGTSDDDKQEREIKLITLVTRKHQEMEASKMYVSNDRPIAVYMLSSTHERWKDVKKELSLQSDDALAKYFVNLFATVVHPVEKTPKICTLGVASQSNGRSKTQQLPINTKQSQITIPADTKQNKAEKVPTKTQDQDTTATSISMATIDDNDVVDVPFTQPIRVKKEIEDEEESQPEVTIATPPIIASSHLTPSTHDKDNDTVAVSGTTRDNEDNDTVAARGTTRDNDMVAASVTTRDNDTVAASGTTRDNDTVAASGTTRDNDTVAASGTTRKHSFMCKCKKRFTSPEKMEKHKLVVHGSKDKYQCRRCCLTYTTMGGLTRHTVRDHSGAVSGTYPCALCDKSFPLTRSLMRHQKTHTETNIFRCQLCRRKFNHRCDFDKHQAELHIKNEDGTYTYKGVKCCKCGYVYETPRALAIHKSTSCKGRGDNLQNSMSCKLCNTSFEDFVQLQNHLEEAHEKDIAGIEEGKNVCPKRYMCPHCDKSFKQNFSLRHHIACNHSTNKPQHTCVHCGRRFNRMSYLRYHEGTHTKNQIKYKCQECPKEYTSKQTLMHHFMNKHRGQRCLCNVCGKWFSTPTILKTHMRRHINDKTHHCPFCNKGFYDPYKMRCHVNAHKGIKDMKCSYCDKMFRYSSSRSLHYRTLHAEEHSEYKKKMAKLKGLPAEEETDHTADNVQETSQNLSEIWEMLNKDMDEREAQN